MSKDGAPAAELEDFYTPNITDPDPPQEMMSEAEMKRRTSRRTPTSSVMTTVSSELALSLG
jgi:hypothetical protein